ncbi:hypothetical protein KR018_005718, partial [Drosophila ironensis]
MRVLQINLHKSKLASAELMLTQEAGPVVVALVQKPWIAPANKGSGLRSPNYNVYYMTTASRARTAILVRKGIYAYILSNYSTDDLTAVALESSGEEPILMAYVAVFVCFASKAVHLELVVDLSTDSFLNVFRRFTGRRGLPEKVVSDNATNFVGASRVLAELSQEFERQKGALQEMAAEKGVVWEFIPPRAPHFGGLWEAALSELKQQFWHSWSRDYLHSLQERHQWAKEEGNLAEGTLVLIHEDNAPPQKWVTGRVVR